MKKTIILIHEVYGITVSLLMLQDDLIKKQFNVLLPSLYEDNFCGKNEKEFYNKFCHDTVIEKGVKNIDCFIKLETSPPIVYLRFGLFSTLPLQTALQNKS